MSDWNARYQGDDYAFGTEPNEFVLSIIHHLPKSGRALDLATGEGRNGIFLAQHGLDTEGVDLSDVGLAKAERLAAEKGVRFSTRIADIAAMDIPEAHYQVISSVFCHFPEPKRSDVARRIIEGLAPRASDAGHRRPERPDLVGHLARYDRKFRRAGLDRGRTRAPRNTRRQPP